MSKWSARRRIGLAVIVAAVGVAALDFLSFVSRAERYGAPDAASADAVVALTGGKGRRIAAAAALSKSEGLPMLVSGVHPSSKVEDIVALSGVDAAFFDCCVTLGRGAASTAGNGLETSNWVRTRQYDQIVVVTSGYHMDRAIIELQRFSPDVEFVAYPVDTQDVTPSRWWRDARNARRTVMEWLKFRGAFARALVARPKADA